MAASLRAHLAHLTFATAAKLLGPNGKRYLMRGGAFELASLDALMLDDREARVQWEPGSIKARVVLDEGAPGRLRAECSRCGSSCEHIGGLLSTLLEHKTDLGLAEEPPAATHADDETSLLAQAIAEREKRAKTEPLKLVTQDPSVPWTDYTVQSGLSGKTYRVALRGAERGISYCSCPDFKTNTLGTCKHVLKALAVVAKKFPSKLRAKPYRRRRITVHVRYDETAELALALPTKLAPEARAIVEPFLEGKVEAGRLVNALQRLEGGGHRFFVTPDAEELIQRRLVARRLSKLVADVRKDPAKHPLRTTLLNEPLLPYQLDGVAFAVGAGRAIIADEMGLGKTIQAVGVAELLAREVDIRKVLVICPASLKSQWRSEIARFSGRSAAVVTGADRAAIYAGDDFFTICNYEQVLRDIGTIERTPWDLVILDEGQRIKNWEAKTSRVVKGLASRFALVLSGTPLENRLEELHSVVAFVDPHRLGPSFRFLHRHHRRDEEGKLAGFKNLDDLRARIAPILLRRTRESVRLEMPPRTVEIVRIPPTEEQKTIHDGHMRIVASIVRKRYLTEMDLLRLRAALLMCRMAANTTLLVDKESPGRSTKLERLAEIFDAIADERDRKVVLFSEWTAMLDLIEPLLEARGLAFVRLDGSIPQKKREALVRAFQTDPKVRFFLTTNAGSTGLNLQAANTVINVDLPWNPAVLEQRIARAHRMGQKRPVSVFVLVTEQTLEESLLGTLSSKRDLALAALDPDTDVTDVDVRKQSDELKSKLEVLLGPKPEAPPVAAAPAQPSARTASALVRAALDLLAEASGDPAIAKLHDELDPMIVRDERGRQRLTLALPSSDTLATLLRGLADRLAPTTSSR